MTGRPLNPAQEAASHTLEGLVVIAAGAGSGKTRTLAERFVCAVAANRGSASGAVGTRGVGAITFTDKAATELAERVRAYLRAKGFLEAARTVDGAWISTIHGMCTRILKRYALEARIDPGFAVADTVVSSRMKKKAFEAAVAAALSFEAGERLLELYPFDALFVAVERIRRETRTRRLRATAAGGVSDPRSLVNEVAEFFGEARLGFASCGVDAPTIRVYHDACLGIESALSALDLTGMREADIAEAAWTALALHKASRSKKEVADLCDEVRLKRAVALEQTALVALAPLGNALVRLAEEYAAFYDSLKSDAGLLDFDDLQHRTLSLLQARPEVLESCRRELRLLMVDEFQDTDALQLDIVRTIAPRDLCTVGDEWQSIYRFRGAEIGVFRRHVAEAAREGASSFDLTRNYRSHPALLDFVYDVFSSEALFGSELARLEHGRDESAQPLLPVGEPRVFLDIALRDGRGEGGESEAEAGVIARRLAALRDTHGIEPSDMVVLVRTYAQAVPIAAALRTRGFAVLTLGGSRFFGLDETLWLTAFCRTIANPMDDEALLEVLLSPLVDANDDALLYVRSTTDRSEHDHLWEGMEVALSRGEPEHAEVLGRATALVRSARERIGAMPLAEILLRAVEESELDLDLLAQGDEGRERFANILKFARMAEDYERAQGFGPAGFVAHLAAKERFGEHESPASLADEKSPAVRIMSIHKAKGLEFAVVALPRLGQGVRKEADIIRCAPEGEELRVALRIPADWKARVRAAGGSEPKAEAESAIFRELGEWRALEELEEAKRLLYVACTRARDVLLLGGTVRQDKQIPADSPLAWLYSALGDLTELRAGESRRIELRGGSLLQAEIHRIDQSATEAPSGEAVCYAPPGSPAGSATGPSAADAARPARSESGEAWRPRELSYSQIELFRACPRKFWARHVSRVGEPVAGRGPAARDFGSAVHLALQLSGGQPIGDEAASSIAARYGLDLEGRQRLEDAVRAFAESSVARGISAHELLSRETPFAVPLGTGDIVLKGFMDVYARTGDRALVVDYKTGTAGEPDGLAKRYLLQAQCYAYASLAAGTTGVEVVFVRPEVVLEDGEPQVIAYAYGAEHAVGIERELLAVAGEMATGTFPSRDAWDRETCAACPIAGIACDIGASRPRGVA